jgi:thymidylate synthase (FAD)
MISEKQVHQHGFVRLLEVMGSDQTVEESARISYGDGTRKTSETRNLIRYLMRHKHTSPFEMAEVRFHLKLPIFVMRQLIRHRTASVNEYSGRYSIMSDDFYLPAESSVNEQSPINNQGRGKEVDEFNKQLVLGSMAAVHDMAHSTYKRIVDPQPTDGFDVNFKGIARELGRAILPVSNYTEVIWKSDLHNFFHMVKLRIDPHAQEEIRDFANAMYELVKPHFPICSEAFEDYSLNAVTFSGPEMKLLKEWVVGDLGESKPWSDYLIDGYFQEISSDGENFSSDELMLEKAEKILCKEYGISKRELKEFKSKISKE